MEHLAAGSRAEDRPPAPASQPDKPPARKNTTHEASRFLGEGTALATAFAAGLFAGRVSPRPVQRQARSLSDGHDDDRLIDTFTGRT
jgi:hypothetical protein